MPSTACDQCYRRKTGCAGEKPVCNRCTVAGLTCTYSTGRPVGKPKGHRKSKSCSASIKQSTSPDQSSPPLSSIHAADPVLNVSGTHPTANTGSCGGIVESPATLATGTTAVPQHPPGFHSTFSGGDRPLFTTSPGNTSQPSRSTASPYEQSISQACPVDEGYFTTTDLPRNTWVEPAGAPVWPMQTFPAAFLVGSSSGIAEIPAFCADANIDQQWLHPVSMGPSAPTMVMHGNSSTLPCQCYLLLNDIGSLFRCQVSLPRTNFAQVIQIIQTAVQKGRTSLECYGCSTHGWPSGFMNVIVMLQQAVVCLQAILAVIDNDACSASDFGIPHGIQADGYHLDNMEPKRRVVHALIKRELDGIQHLALAVRALAQIESGSEDFVAGMMPLLTALDESLDALRRGISPLAQA